MGRPIKKTYFGNLASPYTNFATGGVTGSGGEGVATITNNNTATNYATGTYALSITAPQIGGGTNAAATVTMVGGHVSTITITTAGNGYTSAPTVTLTAATTTGTTATFVAALTSTVTNALAVYAFIPTGTTGLRSDIMKQEASRRYMVRNSEGHGQCKLVAKASGALAAGEMNITATDSGGGTYYVTKLTAHRALLTQYGAGAWEFASGSSVGWNISSPVANVSVTLGNV